MARVPGGGDVFELGARAVVEGIRRGELSAEAYVAALLARARQLRGLNAVISVDELGALAAGRAVDEARARGERLGPLAGLPLVVKDQIDVAGLPTTMGHPSFEGYRPRRDAAIVAQARAAGAIVLAKTNCGPMVGADPARPMSALTTNNPYYGPARNPYDPGHRAGGSSGGNAVAIAARFAPAGIGGDTGGSIRIPAAFCGIAGLRPSTSTLERAVGGGGRKRYPDEGVVPPTGLLETVGPMARTVADVAFLDQVLTGEPTPTVDLRDTRIGVPDPAYWTSVASDPAVRARFGSTAEVLADAGVELVEVDLAGIERQARTAPVPYGQPAEVFGRWIDEHAPEVSLDEVLPRTRERAASAPDPAEVAVGRDPALGLSEQEIGQLVEVHQRYEGLFDAAGITALAFPTQLVRAPRLTDVADDNDQQVEVDGARVGELDLMLRTTLWAASVGAPALTLPMGLAGGLPVGLTLQGPVGMDATVLGLGIAVEDLLGPLPPPPLA